jgi:hypothetical protein
MKGEPRAAVNPSLTESECRAGNWTAYQKWLDGENADAERRRAVPGVKS